MNYGSIAGVVAGLEWHTPPERQGQIVEISYAADPDGQLYWCRVWDHSTGSVEYEVCRYEDAPEDLDWQPWNADPRLEFEPIEA